MFDPSTDFETIVDGAEAVTLLPRGSESVAVATALRRSVGHAEVEASDGRYRAGDTRWHLSQTEYATRPGLGDEIEDADGTRWTIVAVEDATLSARWACVARDLPESFGLSDLVAIERQTTSKGTAGAVERTWTVYRTVRARIQPTTVEMVSDDGAMVTRRAYSVFISEDVEVNQSCRLRDERGNYYRVIGYTGAEQIGELQTIEAEAW